MGFQKVDPGSLEPGNKQADYLASAAQRLQKQAVHLPPSSSRKAASGSGEATLSPKLFAAPTGVFSVPFDTGLQGLGPSVSQTSKGSLQLF